MLYNNAYITHKVLARQGDYMKLLIAGSRSINDFDLSQYVPKETELIISGGAGGIDTVAEEYADRYKISKLILRPQYSRYGKGAPIKRNEVMVELADRVLVIWDGKSKGAKHTADYAKSLNKDVRIVIADTLTS